MPTPHPGAQPNLSQLMAQAQQMQQQMLAAQAELAELEVAGQASGGLVKAVVTGTGDLVSLEIAASVVDPDDIETLQDLVVAAVHDAAHNAQQVAAATMGPMSAGMGGMGLPGF